MEFSAAALDAGDFLFLTYSGHGRQIADLTGDEPDSLDGTWCLYDTELVDDSRCRRSRSLTTTSRSGLAILTLVMAFNFIGDGVRDALDPRLRRGV